MAKQKPKAKKKSVPKNNFTTKVRTVRARQTDGEGRMGASTKPTPRNNFTTKKRTSKPKKKK